MICLGVLVVVQLFFLLALELLTCFADINFAHQVSDEWWCEPGHGDWCTCLERYTLCRDGIYHKVHLAFKHALIEEFTCVESYGDT